MFCPNCGLEDKIVNQFCRACGADLRVVRGALAKPDNITSSAASAREEIGRAFAAKIMETHSAKDLAKITEEVLPEIEKFLESPAEKRLRRLREGTIIASIGAGAGIAFSLTALLVNADLAVLAGLGAICFFIGFGFILNGLLFTEPKKLVPDKSQDAAVQRELDANTSPLVLPEANPNEFSSVIENTTQQLKEKQPISRGSQ